MNLSDLRPGNHFRVAGAHVGMELLSIVDRGLVQRIRVKVTDDETARLIGRHTVHEYVWSSATPVYNVR